MVVCAPLLTQAISPGMASRYITRVIKLYPIDRSVDLALGPKARSIPAQGIALVILKIL